ncbi:MAG: hypothetical protein H0V17_17115, partial [Deltaproteobacteria bacterium]|nr:hypothetical protein [Deltaproteobacteria bacterium]
AEVFVVFAHDRLIAAGSTAIPNVAEFAGATASRATTNHVTTNRAELWLRDAVKQPVTVRATGERVVVPLVYGRGDIAFHVADVVDASVGAHRWTVYVAPDGTPLLRARRTMHGAGTLQFDVPVRHPASTRMLAPAVRANAMVNGNAIVSDLDAQITWTGNADSTVVPSATGELVEVIDAAGVPATASLVGTNGGVTSWSVASDANADAQLTAYVFGMIGKTRARAMHPTLTWLDQKLRIFVNESGVCNALSTGDDLHFFGGGAQCENTARIADIVLHEFGHSVHLQSHLASDEPELALREGIADFFAANITGDSGVGRGLAFDDAPIREIDPVGSELRFPDDVSGVPHTTGLIIAGALWDLRTALIAELGELAGIAATERIYVGVLEHAIDLESSYLAALLGDDDDGDLGNGTPHRCAIEAAFAAHGLVPDFETTAFGTPIVDGRRISITVTPPAATACSRPQITGVDLTWEVAGTTETIAMTTTAAIGEVATYVGELPALTAPTVVTYQLVAHADDGNDVTFPQNPADPRYQLFVGTATPMFCDPLDAQPAWRETGTPAWEWARPFARAGDPPVTFTGEAFLGTNIQGSGQYPADTSTAITTQVIDASGYADVHLQFRRWLTVEDRALDRAAIAINGLTIWENATELDHVDREWRFVDLPVPSGELAITWSIEADATTELGGWNLDDICVVAFDAPAIEPPDDGGCCASTQNPASIVLGVGVLGLALRSRRRATRRGASRATLRAACRAGRSRP